MTNSTKPTDRAELSQEKLASMALDFLCGDTAAITAKPTTTRTIAARTIAATANAYRLYSPVAIDAYYVAVPIIRDCYNGVQDWVANAPSLSKEDTRRLFWLAVAYAATAALWCIDKAQTQLDKRIEYKLQFKLAIIRAKRFKVRQEIKVWSFASYNGIDAKVAAFLVAARKPATYTAIADRVFCLK